MNFTSRPSNMHLYPFFFVSIITDLLTLKHDVPLSTMQLGLSVALIAMELSARYLNQYIEPLPVREGEKRPMSLDTNAGLISRALFFWLTPMIMKGNRQPLDDSDLWELGDVFRCRHVIDQFSATKHSAGLYSRLLRVVGKDLTIQISCGFGICSFA
jgi:hypothetical protein